MIEELQIVLPQAIPSRENINSWVNGNLNREALDVFRGDGCERTNIQLSERYAELLARLSHTVHEVASDAVNSEDRAHDAYFHVHRVENGAECIFVRMILSARLLLLQDVAESPFTVSTERLDCIDKSLYILMEDVLGLPPGGYAEVSSWQTHGSELGAMNRWIRGHQIFAALTQGLIFAFHQLEIAMRFGDTVRAGKALDLAVILLEGSGAAFEFTGDFGPDEYESTIRPSMMPPISQEALSGTMAVDHRCLVQLMREMKPTLNLLRVRDPARHDRLAQALSQVYESHKHVCSRFVGSQKSLIMAECSKKTGVELIEQFKKVRMKVFEPTSAPRTGCPHSAHS